ncbi:MULTISPECIES: DUF2865 domain-containing protein [Methylosinus]|nr:MULTISPECIES: DUF2865 domain-containing protein [Methylosinus]
MRLRLFRASAPPGRRGVVLVAVLLLAAIGAGGRLTSSDALAQGFFQDVFGAFPDQSYRPSQQQMRETRARRLRRAARNPTPLAARLAETPRLRRTAAPDPAPDRGVVVDQPGGLQSYCVRDCDGYFFPVGVYTGSADTTAHQRACGSLCPGARTTLFILRSGSDKIEDAVAARGRSSYSRLTASLRRRGDAEKDKRCSCQSETAAAEPPASALYHDPTLRRGDAVMTAHGVEVFHGGGRYPFTANDFRPLSQTRDVPEGMRRKLVALDRASVRGRSAERRAAATPREHRSLSGRRHYRHRQSE